MKKLAFPIGDRTIGDSSVLIQSMSDTVTREVEHNIALTNDLAKQGMDLMRFSVLDEEDAKALSLIKKDAKVPIIADIHYDLNLALLALDSGVDKLRLNPGNITEGPLLNKVILKAKEKNVPIRIGVNAGSLNRYRGKGKDESEDFFLALDDILSVFRENDYDRIVLSLKTSDPTLTEKLYREAYERYPYPLHVGLTEAGIGTDSAVKSTLAVSGLLNDGIGDTLRISMAEERKNEIRACKTLLKALGMRKDVPELIVCPTCGRTKVDVKPLANEVKDILDYVHKDVKVAIMGCPVNGIGEAKDADIGIAGSGEEDLYVLFEHGRVMKKCSRERALDELKLFIENF